MFPCASEASAWKVYGPTGTGAKTPDQVLGPAPTGRERAPLADHPVSRLVMDSETATTSAALESALAATESSTRPARLAGDWPDLLAHAAASAAAASAAS